MERGEHSGLVCTRQVNCCGSVVAAEEAEVQRVMTAAGLFADAQAREWLRLAHEYTDPDWMELCMARARRAMQIVHDEQEIGSQIVPGGKNAWAAAPSQSPAGSLAERHFEWLGDRIHVTVEAVRDSIAALAKQGYVSPEADQQAAFRRGLGIALNESERQSRAPWVRWLGEADALNYLVNTLWQAQLIYCSGGQRYKWLTLCGVFLKSNGSRYEPSIKSNRCENVRKMASIDKALYNIMRMVEK